MVGFGGLEEASTGKFKSGSSVLQGLMGHCRDNTPGDPGMRQLYYKALGRKD